MRLHVCVESVGRNLKLSIRIPNSGIKVKENIPFIALQSIIKFEPVSSSDI